jgi:hypothetical protein
MRILFLSLLLTGCASNWADYNYGPGDWLSENTPLKVKTMYNYAHLVEPTITVHRVDSVTPYCGTMWAVGCADLQGNHCDIYVGKNASRDTIAHEERHCRGWDHYRPHSERFMAMGAAYQMKEFTRSRVWYPRDDVGNAVAMTRSTHE